METRGVGRLNGGGMRGEGQDWHEGEGGKNAIESGWTNCTIKFY